VYAYLAEQADVDLDAGELWLLARLGEGTAIDLDDPEVVAAYTSLRERGLVDDGRLRGEGEQTYSRVLHARRESLAALLDGWEPEQHDDVRAMLDRLARALVTEIPQTVA
jgi:DNA-binding transcriptional ArsR family regulator